MKVVHVLKRIEMIDEDIKELRKLEKTITRDKSFSTPIYMSIEKQINLLLGERIKLIELPILNPPENYVNEIEGTPEERKVEPIKRQTKKKTASAAVQTKTKPAFEKERVLKPGNVPDEDGMMMFTQDMIDSKFDSIKKPEQTKPEPSARQEQDDTSSLNRKLLDDALEKSSLSKKASSRTKEVKFFRGNFPTD